MAGSAPGDVLLRKAARAVHCAASNGVCGINRPTAIQQLPRHSRRQMGAHGPNGVGIHAAEQRTNVLRKAVGWLLGVFAAEGGEEGLVGSLSSGGSGHGGFPFRGCAERKVGACSVRRLACPCSSVGSRCGFAPSMCSTIRQPQWFLSHPLRHLLKCNIKMIRYLSMLKAHAG